MCKFSYLDNWYQRLNTFHCPFVMELIYSHCHTTCRTTFIYLGFTCDPWAGCSRDGELCLYWDSASLSIQNRSCGDLLPFFCDSSETSSGDTGVFHIYQIRKTRTSWGTHDVLMRPPNLNTQFTLFHCTYAIIVNMEWSSS